MSSVESLNRTLDQEVLALMRGASLECLVCGEFVLHRHGDVECPECGFALRDRKAERPGLQFGLQAG
jgi:rubrerythrin